MEELKTADGITLYAHKNILDQGTGSFPDATWGSFTTSTVERFLEHCYHGDYRAPEPIKQPLSLQAAGPLARRQLVNRRAITQGDNHRSCVTTQDDGTEGSDTEDDDAEGSGTEGDDDKDDTGSSGHPDCLDYFGVFYAHAELYILSQTQGRSPLTALCLDRLREVLNKAAKALTRPRFATDLGRLLFYVYEHDDVKLIDDNQAHNLQNLVSSCVAMHIEEMQEECSLLMRNGGKMAEDLMKEVAHRAINLNSVLKEAEKKEMEKREIEKSEREEMENEQREREDREREDREREDREREDREREDRERREREERRRGRGGRGWRRRGIWRRRRGRRGRRWRGRRWRRWRWRRRRGWGRRRKGEVSELVGDQVVFT
ncbi:hypothetical protein HOY82DRAFT_650556 [Tuber indicum]|nr:hypothetical protein HOY82DRAFT_650556 [Tuber indicum]